MFSLRQDKQSRLGESAGCKHFPESQLRQGKDWVLALKIVVGICEKCLQTEDNKWVLIHI